MDLCYRQMVTGMIPMSYSPLTNLKADFPETKRYHTVTTAVVGNDVEQTLLSLSQTVLFADHF